MFKLADLFSLPRTVVVGVHTVGKYSVTQIETYLRDLPKEIDPLLSHEVIEPESLVIDRQPDKVNDVTLLRHR